MPLEKPCKLWTGALTHKGYGRISHTRYKTRLAHRAAYIKEHGSIPDGLDILHHCDVRSCVEPSHLYAGTNDDNVRDRMERNPPPSLPGELNNNAKLSETDVLHIRRSAFTNTALAKYYGVNHRTISAIRKRKIWTHI